MLAHKGGRIILLENSRMLPTHAYTCQQKAVVIPEIKELMVALDTTMPHIPPISMILLADLFNQIDLHVDVLSALWNEVFMFNST